MTSPVPTIPDRIAAAIDAHEQCADTLLDFYDDAADSLIVACARQVLRAAEVDRRWLAEYGYEDDALRPRPLLDMAARYGVQP